MKKYCREIQSIFVCLVNRGYQQYCDEYQLYFTSEVKTSIFTSGVAMSENTHVLPSRMKYN